MTEPQITCVACLATGANEDGHPFHNSGCPSYTNGFGQVPSYIVVTIPVTIPTQFVQKAHPQDGSTPVGPPDTVPGMTINIPMMQCSMCGAFVQEQNQHTMYHTTEQRRMYVLQRRTNKIRVKRPKDRAPKPPGTNESGQTSPTQSDDDSSKRTEGGSKRKRVPKRGRTNSIAAPSSEEPATVQCEATQDNNIDVGGKAHTCTCNKDRGHLEQDTFPHECPGCNIRWKVLTSGITMHALVGSRDGSEKATLCNAESKYGAGVYPMTTNLDDVTCSDCNSEVINRQRNGIVPPREKYPPALTMAEFERLKRDVRNALMGQRNIEHVRLSDEAVQTLHDILEEENRADTRLVRMDDPRVLPSPSDPVGTLWGIPIVTDDTLEPGQWRIVHKQPRPIIANV